MYLQEKLFFSHVVNAKLLGKAPVGAIGVLAWSCGTQKPFLTIMSAPQQGLWPPSGLLYSPAHPETSKRCGQWKEKV